MQGKWAFTHACARRASTAFISRDENVFGILAEGLIIFSAGHCSQKCIRYDSITNLSGQ